MIALLCYFALIKHYNVRKVLYGRKTVGNGYDYLVVSQCVYCLLYVFFADCVKCRGGFVEQKHFGISQNSTCNRQTLLLSSRKAASALAHNGLVTSFQLGDKFIG